MNTWHSIISTLEQEFSDIPDASQFTRVCVRLSLAVLLGGAMGYDRELKLKAAGLRTHMLVALGAALFVLASQQAGGNNADVSRVVQGIVAGIGFLGAGAILKMSEHREIKGLTTAASIWLTAAIGVAVGLGRDVTAILCTVLAVVILALLPRIPWIHHIAHSEATHEAKDPK